MLARRHQNSGRTRPGQRNASHRQWIRGHVCAAASEQCSGNIECAHVEGSGTGGMGSKADDWATIPLCHFHHAARHSAGWRTFDKAHRIDALTLARDLARKSPAIVRGAIAAGYPLTQGDEA